MTIKHVIWIKNFKKKFVNKSARNVFNGPQQFVYQLYHLSLSLYSTFPQSSFDLRCSYNEAWSGWIMLIFIHQMFSSYTCLIQQPEVLSWKRMVMLTHCNTGTHPWAALFLLTRRLAGMGEEDTCHSLCLNHVGCDGMQKDSLGLWSREAEGWGQHK